MVPGCSQLQPSTLASPTLAVLNQHSIYWQRVFSKCLGRTRRAGLGRWVSRHPPILSFKGGPVGGRDKWGRCVSSYSKNASGVSSGGETSTPPLTGWEKLFRVSTRRTREHRSSPVGGNKGVPGPNHDIAIIKKRKKYNSPAKGPCRALCGAGGGGQGSSYSMRGRLGPDPQLPWMRVHGGFLKDQLAGSFNFLSFQAAHPCHLHSWSPALFLPSSQRWTSPTHPHTPKRGPKNWIPEPKPGQSWQTLPGGLWKQEGQGPMKSSALLCSERRIKAIRFEQPLCIRGDWLVLLMCCFHRSRGLTFAEDYEGT